MRNPFERAGRRIIRRLGQPVVLHLDSGDKEITAVFEISSEQSKLEHGGYVQTPDATLTLMIDDVEGVIERTKITVGSDCWYALKKPELMDEHLATIPLAESLEQEENLSITY